MNERPDPAAALRAYRTSPPDVAHARPLPLAPIPAPAGIARRLLNTANEILETYQLGECSVIVTFEHRLWHLSIACPRRIAPWDEISQSWYRIVAPRLRPGRCGVLALPDFRSYVNIHKHCFQVMEIDGVAQGFVLPPDGAGEVIP